MKILIVDDERELVAMLIEWLSGRGHEVFGITGGSDAASWVKKSKCDVVLLDVRLPDADGLSMISGLVKTTMAKVIVMSGLNRESWVAAAMENGAFDCIAKPISLPVLEQALERVSRTIQG